MIYSVVFTEIFPDKHFASAVNFYGNSGLYCFAFLSNETGMVNKLLGEGNEINFYATKKYWPSY